MSFTPTTQGYISLFGRSLSRPPKESVFLPILQTIGRIGKVSKVLPSGDVGIEYKLGGGHPLLTLLQGGLRTVDWVFNPACLKKVMYRLTLMMPLLFEESLQ